MASGIKEDIATRNLEKDPSGIGIEMTGPSEKAFCIMDSSGAILKNIPSSLGVYSTDIVRNNNGEYGLVASTDYGAIQGGTIGFATFDSSGMSMLLKNKIQISGTDLASGQILFDNGNYLISGNGSNLSNGLSTGYLFKISPTGSVIWARKFSPVGSLQSKINSILIAVDGSYVIAGSEGSANLTNHFVVKMDSAGNVCQSAIPTYTTASLSLNNSTVHSLYVNTTSELSNTVPIQIDKAANNTSICTTLKVDEISVVSESILYPNPAGNTLYLKTPMPSKSLLSIFGIDGKLIMKDIVVNKQQVDIHELPSGSYILLINDQVNKVIGREMFLKN